MDNLPKTALISVVYLLTPGGQQEKYKSQIKVLDSLCPKIDHSMSACSHIDHINADSHINHINYLSITSIILFVHLLFFA